MRSVRIILYPGGRLSRAMMHVAATMVALPLAIYVGLTDRELWWVVVGAYVGAFLGIHVVLIPVMTAWHAFEVRLERMVRSVVEEELMAYDLKTYDRQLGRILEHKA